MEFDAILQGFGSLFTNYGSLIDAGLLIFARIITFLFTCPLFNRKDIPFPIKLNFGIFLTVIFLWLVPIENPISPTSGNLFHFLLLIIMNTIVGGIIGFTADMILKAISAAGSLMNSQIGLSSAVLFDPSSKAQVMILDRFFALLGILIFMHIGGIFWIINALERSFEIFPLFSLYQDIVGSIDMSYLVLLSANVMLVATQLVAPVILVTMSIDVILGIVNRTAQQMPVFQLSFALKPSVGISVLLATLPIFLKAIRDFLSDFSFIF